MTEQKTAPKISRERHELRATIEEIRGYLQRPRPEPGSDKALTWASSLSGLLVQLHDQTSRMFRDEERMGLHPRLIEQYPHAAHEISALRTEHDRILCDFRMILGAAMIYTEGKQPENPQLRRWTESTIDRLFEHDHEETDLVARLALQDLGGRG